MQNIKKNVLVLAVYHSYDSTEVLGVFDDKEKLKAACKKILGKDNFVIKDISNLHIFECPLNTFSGIFYPDDYDNPNSKGVFMEEQTDITKEILDMQ